MREFVVTLRCGVKFVVKAEQVILLDRQFLALIVRRDGEDNDTVALFDRGQVAAVVARDHLVSEERGEPLDGRFVGEVDDPIPF